MAKIEIADFGVIKAEHMNISEVVGVSYKNEKSDVMLIQALFKILGGHEFMAKKFFGLTSGDLPEPTGNFDQKTIRAIWGLQKKMSHRLQNVDGKVHPASYQNRVLRRAFKGGRLMTITFLNIFAQEEALMNYNTDPISAVKLIAPQIIFTPPALQKSTP